MSYKPNLSGAPISQAARHMEIARLFLVRKSRKSWIPMRWALLAWLPIRPSALCGGDDGWHGSQVRNLLLFSVPAAATSIRRRVLAAMSYYVFEAEGKGAAGSVHSPSTSMAGSGQYRHLINDYGPPSLGYTQGVQGTTSSSSSQVPQSKYAELLAIIEELGKEIRPTYAGSKSAMERLKRGIIHARGLVRECLAETERNARS